MHEYEEAYANSGFLVQFGLGYMDLWLGYGMFQIWTEDEGDGQGCVKVVVEQQKVAKVI